MGLIKVLKNTVDSVLADQWKEYFYCDALSADVLAAVGKKRVSGRSANTKGSDNIISSGSVISVADGQCMLIVEQGQVVEVCAETGEFTFDASTEPSIFTGVLDAENIMNIFKIVGRRFTFGGDTAKDQRVYYFNIKEIIGNKFGTASPVPFRVVDERAGLDVDIAIRCFGEYSYKLTNPLLFYSKVCGNFEREYRREELDSQLKAEFLSALQPGFARISEMKIRYSALPAHTEELSKAMNEVLSEKWRDIRGIEIVSVGVASVKASEEDEAMIKEMQKNAAFADPRLAAAYRIAAQGEAMKAAAANPNAGPAMAFMGMNMAGQMGGGMDVQGLYQMAQQEEAQAAARQQAEREAAAASQAQVPPSQAATSQDTPVPQTASPAGPGNAQADASRPEAQTEQTGAAEQSWTCPTCGSVNHGKFCPECGTKMPESLPKYRCSTCGWEPADPTHPPKFCPECGNPFDDGDIVK